MTIFSTKKPNNLWVVTSYYNPCRWKTRRQNYDQFIDHLNSLEIPHITIECVFCDEDWELPNNINIIKTRADSLLWQKERLINLAVSWLPKECEYVAWLDCDIIFENLNIKQDIISELIKHPIVQTWETADKLEQDGINISEQSVSFAAVMNGIRPPAIPDNNSLNYNLEYHMSKPQPADIFSIGRYDTHGHTGYGWAMRREIFNQVGLYEHAIAGSADHFMAHAIYNNYGFCITNALKHDYNQISHLKHWGKKFYQYTQGQLGCVAGNIKHLWHGETADRQYFKRMHEITNLNYNPWSDIVLNTGKPLSWDTDVFKTKPELINYFSNHFKSRKEDGK